MKHREGFEFAQSVIPERILRGMRTGEEVHEYLAARVSRRSVLKGLGLAGLAGLASPVLWSKPGRAAEPPRGVHLSYGTDPRREMNVSWFTQASVAKPVVDVGPTSAYGTVVEAESVTYLRPADYGGVITIQHHATIRGLEPDTSYHYRVRHQGAAAEDATFRTAPDRIEPFRFTAFGDHGIDPGTNHGRTQQGTPYSKVAVGAVAALQPRFHLVAGDISYATGVQDVWDTWCEDAQPSAAVTPWMVGLGNHEMEHGFGPQGYDPFRSRFRVPDNGLDWKPERTGTFYAFQHANVLMVVLDGNEAASESGYDENRGYLKGAQDRWLRSTLHTGRTNPTVDWIVVSFHNCMYCTDVLHGSDGGCRARWQAIFEEFEVDVVLNGHNHCYERSYPIRGADYTILAPTQPADPVGMGVTYLCVGGGGNLARAASTYPTAAVFDEEGGRQTESGDWRARRFDGHSLAVFDVDPGAAGGTTTLKLSAREFMGPGLGEVDALTLERPAKAIVAGRVGGGTATPAPKPGPVVGGVRNEKELPATGSAAATFAAGAAAAAAPATIARSLHEPGHADEQAPGDA